MRMHFRHVTVIAALCVLPHSARTQAAPTVSDAKTFVARLLNDVSADAINAGATAHHRILDSLRTFATKAWMVRLEGGREYIVDGVCDEDCTDLDMRLHTTAGATVQEDFELDDMPRLRFVAPRTDQYRLSVTMANCALEPCHVALDVSVFPRTTARGSDTPLSATADAPAYRANRTLPADGACSFHGFPINVATARSTNSSGSLSKLHCKRAGGQFTHYAPLPMLEPQEIQLELVSTQFAAQLLLRDSTGALVAESRGDTALIVQRLNRGVYYVGISTTQPGDSGRYRFRATSRTPIAYPPSVRDGTCSSQAAQTLPLEQAGVSAGLSTTSCARSGGQFARYFSYVLFSRERVHVEVKSDQFDAYLVLRDSKGHIVDVNDNGGQGTNARITRALEPGIYYVVASTTKVGETGNFSVRVGPAAP